MHRHGSAPHPLASFLIVLAGLIAGCAAGDPVEPLPEADATGRTSALHGPTAKAGLAFTTSDELAWFDVSTGQLVATAPASTGAAYRDLAYHPAQNLLFRYETDEEEGWGTIAHQAVDWQGRKLGAVEPGAGFEGIARLTPVPEGLLVHAQSYLYAKWFYLGTAGQSSSTWAKPPLASPWWDESHGTSSLHTVVEQDGRLATQRVVVDGSDVEASAPTPLSPAMSVDAQVLWSITHQAEITLAPTADGIAWSLGDEEAYSIATPSFQRIEAAAILADEPHRLRIALAVSEPSRLIVVDRVGCNARIGFSARIDADVGGDSRVFQRIMAPLDPSRVLLATTSGVIHLEVGEAAGGTLVIEPREGFEGGDLRAPILAIQPPALIPANSR